MEARRAAVACGALWSAACALPRLARLRLPAVAPPPPAPPPPPLLALVAAQFSRTEAKKAYASDITS